MGILDQIKHDAESSSQSKKDFFYVKSGEKRKIRFLNDMEDAFTVEFHSNYDANIKVPCQKLFGRDCAYCEDESVRTSKMYVWSVWDYDANAVQLFMFSMNRCSPLGSIAAMYETYGTLKDRDYVIGVTGKGFDKTYQVIPADKSSFSNKQAKPFSKQAFMKTLDKAYPDSLSKGNTKGEEEDGGWDDDAMNEPKNDYSSKKPKELYDMCKERGIDCEPKKPGKYYQNLLEEDDRAQKDWAEDDEEEGEED